MEKTKLALHLPKELLEVGFIENFGQPLVHTHEKLVCYHHVDPLLNIEKEKDFYFQTKNWVHIAPSIEVAERLSELGFSFVRVISPFIPIRKNIDTTDNSICRIGFSHAKTDPSTSGADVLCALIGGSLRKNSKLKFEVYSNQRIVELETKLKELGVAFYQEDDFWNKINLYVSPRRLEVNIQDLCEAIGLGIPVLCSPVGFAKDLLDSYSLFKDLSEGIEKLTQFFSTNDLTHSLQKTREIAQNKYSETELKKAWEAVVASIKTFSFPQQTEKRRRSRSIFSSKLIFAKAYQGLSRVGILGSRNKKNITLWGEFVEGPYGGGNQVLKAVAKELRKRDIGVHFNSFFESDGHILNSAFFDTKKLSAVLRSSKEVEVIQRIDGPISLYRNADKNKDRTADEKIFEVNERFATATAFQCVYSWRESLNLGFNPIRPLIIRNASDRDFFLKKESLRLQPNRKIKLVSTSWSTNAKKGFSVYDFLDSNLDFNRYDYTFIGRSPIEFKNIKMCPALASAQLGAKLREADIFVSASLFDAASNSVLEAVQTGLPVIYVNSGGHSEFTKFCGLPFNEASEIPSLLEKIINDYESYAECTYTNPVENTVDNFLKALNLA
ncbi:MAG: hypothetical protein AB7F43_13125 [Bacteriovoracia bacterium]